MVIGKAWAGGVLVVELMGIVQAASRLTLNAQISTERRFSHIDIFDLHLHIINLSV